MKIEPNEYEGTLTVDVQTRRDGNSAMKIAWDDRTEVIFGGLCARVKLFDLRIEVVMNPDRSAAQWKDREWAREQAMAVLCRPDVAPLLIAAIADFHFKLGKGAGREECRSDLRKLLGVST